MNRLSVLVLGVLPLFLFSFFPEECLAANEQIEIATYSDLPRKINVNGYLQFNDANGNEETREFKGVIKESVEVSDYLIGVVFGEVGLAELPESRGGIANEAKRIELYKAQIVAAANKLKVKLNKGVVNGTTAVQAYRLRDVIGGQEKPYPPAIIKAISEMSFLQTDDKTEDVSVMKYPKTEPDGTVKTEIFETFYYSNAVRIRTKTVNGNTVTIRDPLVGVYTRNSENWFKKGKNDNETFGYSPCQRSIKTSYTYTPTPSSTPESSFSIISDYADRVHGVGMHQLDAIKYARNTNGITYDAILRRYYHPSPPYVKAVTVMQRVENVQNGIASNIGRLLYKVHLEFDPKKETRVKKDWAMNFTNTSRDEPITINVGFSEHVKSVNIRLLGKGNRVANPSVIWNIGVRPT